MLEAWTIGIRVSVLDYATSGLRAISSAFMRADGDAAKFEKRLGSIKGQLVAGGLMVGAGVGLAAMFDKPIKAAVGYEQQLNRLKAMNLGAGATGTLVHAALDLSKNVKGTSTTDALRLATETQAITGNLEHTLDLLPRLAKMRFGIEAYTRGNGGPEGQGEVAESQFQALTKSTELRGLMRNYSGEKTQELLDLFQKSFIASGGQVKPSDFLAMMKTGGVAAKLVNSDFMLAMGHMIQESGGSRSGTALMSGYQNLVGGRTTQQVAELLNSMGMLSPGSIHYGKTGHVTKVEPGALLQSELFQSNPLDYLNQVILPKAKAKGVDPEDPNKMLPLLNQMFSNRNASKFFSQLYLDRSVIAAFVEQAKKAMGGQELYDQESTSTQGQLLDLQAKTTTLMQQIGVYALPVLNTGLSYLIPRLKELSGWMLTHRHTVKLFVLGLLGLSAALISIGSLSILVGGFRAIGLAFVGVRAAASLAEVGVWRLAASTNLLKGSALLAAGAIGYFVGTLLKAKADAETAAATGDKNDTIGTAAYDRINPFNKKTGKHEFSFGGLLNTIWNPVPQGDALQKLKSSRKDESDYIRTGPPRKSETPAFNLYVDGKQITHVVTERQAKAASRAQSGTSGFDPSRQATPIGVTGGM